MSVRVRVVSTQSTMSTTSIFIHPLAPFFRPFSGPSPACPDDPVVAPEFSPGASCASGFNPWQMKVCKRSARKPLIELFGERFFVR